MSPAVAKAGVFAASLVVFSSGYFAMKTPTSDWPRLLLLVLLATGGGLAASIFSRHTR